MLQTAALIAQRERWTFSLRARRKAVDGIPLRAPIFMLGTQGGGLTLLARVFKRHRDVVSATGGYRQWTGSDEIGSQASRMERLPPSLWGCKRRFDIPSESFGVSHSNVYATAELLPQYRLTAADATAEDAAAFQRLLREHIAVYGRDRSQARFLDKTQTYTLKIPYIDALLDGADARFLLVTRSPYVMAIRSVLRQPPTWRRHMPLEDRLRWTAEHWATSFEVALRDGALLGDRFTVVRFEDFLASPESVVRALCERLDLEFAEGLLPGPEQELPFARWPGDSKWYPLLPDKWGSKLTDAQRALVEEICGPVASTLGYFPHGLDAPLVPCVGAPELAAPSAS
jgi:hypothetical protein